MMATPFTALNKAFMPFRKLLTGRPVVATFQVNRRCNSACGYCDLPLNVGRYKMTREEIQGVFFGLYCDGVRFVLVQGRAVVAARSAGDPRRPLYDRFISH